MQEHVAKGFGQSRSLERTDPAQQLVEQTAQRKEVGTGIERVAGRLFRRHREGCARNDARAGEIQLCLFRVARKAPLWQPLASLG